MTTSPSVLEQGDVLWSPPADWRTSTRLGEFVRFVESSRGLQLDDWQDLWSWSVTDLEGFWSAIWEHFGVQSDTPYDAVLALDAMPGARWFEGARISYARHLLADTSRDDEVAVVAHSQTRDRVELTFGELRREVARARAGLVRLGVGPGDRVVAYLPNIPETLVAFLATASLGAVWASCAPEFGSRSVVDRFAQVEPTVLLVVAGYRFGAKDVDRTEEVAEIRRGLPTVEHVVQVPYGGAPLADTVSWPDLLDGTDSDLAFEPVAFDHPLYVLFSSGTTGKPKAIVHGHGGILLEHLKNHALSWDLGPGDRLLWFSTTAWMMWNALVSALLVRASIVMIDGNPMYPDLDLQWRLAAETGATLMGASPGFLMASRKEGLAPARDHDLSRVRQIGAAGSPLPVEGYAWVAEQFGPGVLLNVGSGGTDVCSGIVQGSPLQPVRAGEIAGACLGVAAAAYGAEGRPVVGELGELVITRPMPSMPVGFWGDADGSRYRATYFEDFPGVWRHGDWVRFGEHGSCVITGRSDATLNRGGVRLGTAEFYRVVEEMPEVEDSLVVHLEDPAGGNGELILYVVPAAGVAVDDGLRAAIGRSLRTALSPRHVPDTIVEVSVVPHNRTGKKLELPVKRLLQGRALEEVAALDSLARPDALDAYVAHAESRGGAHMRSEVERVALIGAGVIGNAWAAHLLAHGRTVSVTDPDPSAEARLRRDVEHALPVLGTLGLRTEGWEDRLSFTVDLAPALDGADFVQENGPERPEVKSALFAELDALVPPDVVVASSSSSMRPSTLAAMCGRHPERVIVGHPFNPVYLIPLVEVVGTPQTPQAVIDAAIGFYAGVGKRPVHVRQEVPGHLANRLQAALWREAYSLVERGVATVTDVDLAIANGPGLRWALLGPLANQHLSGGDGGLAHILEHLGPPTQQLMEDLGSVVLTPELAKALVTGVNEELDGIDMAALAAERDALLVGLLTAKSRAEVLP